MQMVLREKCTREKIKCVKGERKDYGGKLKAQKLRRKHKKVKGK